MDHVNRQVADVVARYGLRMRLGVLDIGSNTVHLLVVDAQSGARPVPAASFKNELRLAEHLSAAGDIDPDGVDQLVTFVADAMAVAAESGVEHVLPFATSAVREARNSDDVLGEVERRTGVRPHVLPGQDEARLTFLAARRWYGWSAGRLLVLDIGGGSLEVAAGPDEAPDQAISLPLGAGRLTREAFAGAGVTVAATEEVAAARLRVRREVARLASEVFRAGSPDMAVATSKTFRSLARMCSGDDTPVLRRSDLREWVPKLAGMSAAQRSSLPGISLTRAPQLLAGAIVAEALLDLLDLDRVDICPWALREGVILHYFDSLPTSADPARLIGAVPAVRP